VLDYGAAVVVLATGSHWSGDGLQAATHVPIDGADPALPHVLTPEQVAAEGRRPPGRRVAVYDAEGYVTGPGIAQLLAAEGFEVTLVTPLDLVSPLSDLTVEGPLLRRALHDAGVRMVRGVTITAVEAGRATGETEFEEPWALDVDGVVLVTQQVSHDGLYQELVADPAALAAAGIRRLVRIGDAVAPRMPSEAVFEGHRCGREIELPDPMAVRAYDRERRVPDVAPSVTR
jgi:dimethylamine/trimethylamine dehydrogenase